MKEYWKSPLVYSSGVLAGAIILVLFWTGWNWQQENELQEQMLQANFDLEKHLETRSQNEFSIEESYNLASAYYHQEKFDEGIETLKHVLSSEEVSSLLSLKSLYNLGNQFYRRAEKAETPQEALDLYLQSARYYRDVLELLIHGETAPQNILEQTRDNLALVKKRVKIAKSQIGELEKKESNQEEENLYQLLVELLEEEQAVEQKLSSLRKLQIENPQLSLSDELQQLLTKRDENFQKLAGVEKKVEELLAPPSTGSNLKTSGKI